MGRRSRRAKRARPGESSRGSNPSLPRYGDTESDDPRRSHTEAGGEVDADSGDETEGVTEDDEEV